MLKPVRRPKSPYWVARGTVAGTPIERSTGTTDFAEAKRRCITIAAEVAEAQGRADPALPYTFADAAADYIASGFSSRYVARLVDHMGKVPISDLTTSMLARAGAALYPSAKPSTVNRQVFTPASAIYGLAASDGHCAPRAFRRPKGSAGEKRTDYLTPAQVDRLIDAAHPRDGRGNGYLPAMLTFMVGQGTRPGETLTIDARDDVDLEAGVAFVRPEGEKTGRERKLTLRPRVIAALSTLPTIGNPGPIFRTVAGLPYVVDGYRRGGQIEFAFNAARERAGIPSLFTPYHLRHTFATWFYAQTTDVLRLKAEGGWSRDTWERYAKIGSSGLGEDALAHGWDFRADLGKNLGTAPASTIKALKWNDK